MPNQTFRAILANPKKVGPRQLWLFFRIMQFCGPIGYPKTVYPPKIIHVRWKQP
jgi:hypothetical protein